MITVVVIQVRALPTDDGKRHRLTVLDQSAGRYGDVIMDDVILGFLLGDCPTSDLVEIDPSTVLWKR